MKNIYSNITFVNLIFFHNISFRFLRKLPIRHLCFLNFIFQIKNRYCYSDNCILKCCKVWKQCDNVNYICTGGILLGDNSVTEKEEHDMKLLKQVRYLEYTKSQRPNNSPLLQERNASLKIMTYNVLSQTLLEDHSYLYRNASPITLKWEYRFPRLFGEILEHNPDILCLQEVQEDHISPFFSRLEDIGFVGVYKKRTGGKVDGCSIYFKADIFSLVEKAEVDFFKPGVKQLNRDNVGIIVRLFWYKGNRHVTVANTHLLYNPRRTDVRLAQISELLSELNTITDFGRNGDLVFLTGDLNSDPASSVIELLSKGYVTNSTYRIYSKPIVEKSDHNKEERNESLDPSFQMCHYFNFKSVHPHMTENGMEVTTYQDRWLTVDYMFYSGNNENLCLHSRLRLPTTKESQKNIKRLPNFASPSDHLPLIATFNFTID